MENIKQDVLKSNDLQVLRERKVELTELTSAKHMDTALASTVTMKVKCQGELSQLYVLQSILDDRIKDIRDETKNDNAKNYVHNKNFRLAAKSILKESTFDLLEKLARMTKEERESSVQEIDQLGL